MAGRIRDLDQVKEIVRAEAPIEKVIESYGVKVLPAGAEYKAVCPFHPDNDPSLGISASKQLYLCRGCHEAGDVFRFVQLMEDVDFFTALRKLAEYGNVDLHQYEDDPTPEEAQQQTLIKLNHQIEYHIKTDAKMFIRWFEGRKFDPAILMEYGVGYMAKVPQVEAPRDIKESMQLWRQGKPYTGKWVNRIIVPLRNERGQVMAFRTRSVDGSIPKVIGPEEGHPLPVPVLYGLWEARKAIRQAGYAILVEGEPDVWQMRAHGYHNVIGTLGNHFNTEQATLLVELGVRRVVLMPDADDGGRKFALRVSKQFRHPGLDIRLAALKDGDPDETLLRDPSEVEDALNDARHVLEYAINHVLRQHEDLTQITTRMDVLHEMREVLKDVPDVERSLAYDHLSSVLGMATDDLADYFRTVGTVDRLHNVAAEKIALAQGIRDEQYLGDLILTVKPEDMFLNRHRRIYEGMVKLYRSSEKVSPDTVAIWLENQRNKADASYVRGLADVDTTGAEFVLSDIKDKSVRRAVQKTASDMATRIADTSTESKIILDGFTSRLASVVVGNGDKMITTEQLISAQMIAMHERIREPNLITGLDWGPDWKVLNHTLHGFNAGRYMVLAAPSEVGKTAIAVAWMKRFGIELGEPCLYLTFETGAEALNLRLLSSVSGVEADKITTGFLTPEEVERVHEAASIIAAAPIIITSRGQTWEEAQAIIRHDILRRGTKVIFADYLQLMGLANPAGIARYLEIGRISRGFLEITQEYGTRTVALAQINREGAKRGRSSGLDLGDSFIPFQDSDHFYVVDVKTDEEIEEDGIELGNRSGLLDKNRHGRSKVRSNLMFDQAILRVREVHPKSDHGGGR